MGRLEEARKNLDAVTNATFATGKGNLLKKLDLKQAGAANQAE